MLLRLSSVVPRMNASFFCPPTVAGQRAGLINAHTSSCLCTSIGSPNVCVKQLTVTTEVAGFKKNEISWSHPNGGCEVLDDFLVDGACFYVAAFGRVWT